MSTPFDSIYKRAVYRFRDYDFCRINEADVNDVMQSYIMSAISDFAPVCEQDLNDIDPVLCEFRADLTNEEQEILALGISFYWLSAQLLNQELLKNSLSTKDYTYFSPANLLRESQTLRDSVRKEYRDRITKYTYHHGDVAGISAKG